MDNMAYSSQDQDISDLKRLLKSRGWEIVEKELLMSIKNARARVLAGQCDTRDYDRNCMENNVLTRLIKSLYIAAEFSPPESV